MACDKGIMKLNPRAGVEQLYCPIRKAWSPSGRLCELCNADPEFWQKRDAARARAGIKPCIPCTQKKSESGQQSQRGQPPAVKPQPTIPTLRARKDLRGCSPCRAKMLAAMKAAIPLPAEIKAAEQPVASGHGVPAPVVTRAPQPGKAGTLSGGPTAGQDAGAAPPSGIKPGVYLESYRNLHAGRRGFVMATGPSVAQQDIGWLRNEIVVGVNYAHLITGNVTPHNPEAWTPTYMATADHRLWPRGLTNKNGILPPLSLAWPKLDTKIVCTDSCLLQTKHFKSDKLVSQKGISLLYRSNEFTFDCTKPLKIHKASSSTGHLAIPWAMFLGLNPIYLLGCDCTAGGHAYADLGIWCARAMAIWTEGFFPAMRVIRGVAEKHGIQIFNATLHGNLEEFPRVDLDSLKGG